MCVFCKIIEGSIPSYKVYEDENVLAILDISQATIGHTLVMPKKHVRNITEADEEVILNVFKVVGELSKKICANLNCDCNILNNNGSTAGQTVEHLHVHIIPRYKGDSFEINFPSNKLSSDEFNSLLDKISK